MDDFHWLKKIKQTCDWSTFMGDQARPRECGRKTYVPGIVFHFFLNEATAVTSGISVCKTFHANIPISDLPMLNIE